MVATLLLAVAACAPDPVDWSDPAPLPPGLASAPRLRFDPANRLAPDRPPELQPPRVARQCASSVRVAGDTTGRWYAVWWSVRDDSTADLVAAYSPDGRSWAAPVTVDTLDAAPVGCRRPPPSIAVDSGNVHVAYAMTAREGPGIFASHSMDRGTMFHSPVPVVYGERIGAVAIAARGLVVAVAYEDPNGTQDQIGLALSRTMAHLFQYRLTVSPPADSGRRPDVAIGDGRIAVTWSRGSDTASRVLRLGTIGNLP